MILDVEGIGIRQHGNNCVLRMITSNLVNECNTNGSFSPVMFNIRGEVDVPLANTTRLARYRIRYLCCLDGDDDDFDNYIEQIRLVHPLSMNNLYSIFKLYAILMLMAFIKLIGEICSILIQRRHHYWH